VPAIAFATFVASYPYLWSSPGVNTFRMFEFRADSFALQALNAPANVPNRTDAFRRLGHELGDRFSTGRYLAEAIDGWIGLSLPTSIAYLDLVLAASGFPVLVALIVRDGFTSPRALTFAVLGGQALLIMLTLRVEYARYFLPLLLLIAICAGVLVGALWRFAQSRLLEIGQRRRSGTPLLKLDSGSHMNPAILVEASNDSAYPWNQARLAPERIHMTEQSPIRASNAIER
jgi:hypothetical protein